MTRDWRDRLHGYVPQDWIFPIVLALFVGIVVWFGRAIHDFLLPPANTVSVPSFVGQTMGDAKAEIARLHLSENVIATTTSDRYPKGVVVNQQPDPGAQVRQGRQISFVVSGGIIARLMPDLRYQSMREVGLDLSRAHLQLGTVTYVKSQVVPAGHVIDQDPAPLANVAENDKVDVTESKGGAVSMKLPDFVGESIDDVRDAMSKGGISLGQIVWTPLGRNGPAHGQVARQFPPAGSKIDAYEPVSLQVSAGPYESGYLLHQVRVLVSVPVPEGATTATQLNLKLTVTDATGRYDLYDAFAQPGQKLDFTVTAVGTSVLDMYVNNVLVGESRLGQEPTAIYDQKSTSPPGGAP
ncbi:MAG TPA: PASTA domain-containing protein [Verrucomicrobiae bacterium]|nr:PASTA domain-containing protein [Verrucomicrobiae bacterium]